MSDNTADQEIEKAARALCQQRGFDPDARAAYGKPLHIDNKFYLAPIETAPLWTFFAPTVRQIRDLLKS